MPGRLEIVTCRCEVSRLTTAGRNGVGLTRADRVNVQAVEAERECPGGNGLDGYVAYPLVKSMVASATCLPSAAFSCVVSFPALDVPDEVVDVDGLLEAKFEQPLIATTGSTTTPAAAANCFIMKGAYPRDARHKLGIRGTAWRSCGAPRWVGGPPRPARRGRPYRPGTEDGEGRSPPASASGTERGVETWIGVGTWVASGATERPRCSILVTKGDVIARTSAP